MPMTASSPVRAFHHRSNAALKVVTLPEASTSQSGSGVRSSSVAAADSARSGGTTLADPAINVIPLTEPLFITAYRLRSAQDVDEYFTCRPLPRAAASRRGWEW